MNKIKQYINIIKDRVEVYVKSELVRAKLGSSALVFCTQQNAYT